LDANSNEEEDGSSCRTVRKAIYGKVPPFMGKHYEIGEATTWFSILEAYLEAVNITNDEDKKTVAVSYLRGEVVQWFRSFKHTIKTFEDFKKGFLGTFEMADIKEHAYKEFHNLRQGNQTVQQYQTKFNAIANLLPELTEEMKLQKYIYGLDPRIRDHLLENKLTGSFLDATTAAMRKGHFLERSGSWKRDDRRNNKPKGQQSLGAGAIQNKNKSFKKKGCWTCGLPDHFEKNCPKAKQGSNKAGKRVNFANMTAEASPQAPDAAVVGTSDRN